MTVWNERSKTCPACRAAVRTKADLIRIEFAPGDMKNELQFYQKKIIDKSAEINKLKAEIATLELDGKIFEITKSQKMKWVTNEFVAEQSIKCVQQLQVTGAETRWSEQEDQVRRVWSIHFVALIDFGTIHSDFQTGKIEPRPKVDHKANLE